MAGRLEGLDEGRALPLPVVLPATPGAGEEGDDDPPTAPAPSPAATSFLRYARPARLVLLLRA